MLEYLLKKDVNWSMPFKRGNDGETVRLSDFKENMNIKKMFEFRDKNHPSRITQINCQICNFGFREKYGVDYAEAHHIIPFVESMNNNPENILILCPNHHRVIHRCNPVWDSAKKTLYYKNSLIEKIIEIN
ncbi:MAG: HNH endonuclease [Vallitaleaceae bacterium]|nr:HNH endonuclease [Vallitaleaceae bacterium]